MFFDSHPWLESDCEDYYSINGGKYTLNVPLKSFVSFYLLLNMKEFAGALNFHVFMQIIPHLAAILQTAKSA